MPEIYYHECSDLEVAYNLTDENGTGFWEPERVGVDNDEVGSTEMWEGMGSTTTLGGLDDLSSFDHL